MLLKRIIFATFIAALTILTVFDVFAIAVAETSKSYMLMVSTKNVEPSSKIQITIRSIEPGEILFIVVVDEKGNPANVSILEVYKGVVVQVGHLIIVRTGEVDALAVFCIKAPSKPGVYTVKLYDPIGEVEIEEQIVVKWSIQQLLKRSEVIIAGLLILAAVLATMYLFMLTPL